MNNITIDQIKALLPKTVSLHYVDRNSSLDDHTDLIQKCIVQGDLCPLYEQVDDWFIDDHYGFDAVKEELIVDMQKSFDIEEEEAEDLFDFYYDELRDAIENKDDSDLIKDLFRNTSDFVMFYDTGHYVECAYPFSEEDCVEQLAEIKRVIKLDSNDYDELIKQMMYQASYGGNLVIYFRESGYDVVRSIEEGCNTISFRGEVNIAIPNHSCGAGDHTSFKHSLTLPFTKENLFLCREVKYSYTYEVCGMRSNWCESTVMELKKVETPYEKPVISDKAAYLAREAELDRVYKSGGCTAGDTNFGRHRNVQYHNEPMYCRNECPTCHTVWID
jgi:hypothetical protein